jgi:hypothetical protein
MKNRHGSLFVEIEFDSGKRVETTGAAATLEHR